jgi:hypothetical protein
MAVARLFSVVVRNPGGARSLRGGRRLGSIATTRRTVRKRESPDSWGNRRRQCCGGKLYLREDNVGVSSQARREKKGKAARVDGHRGMLIVFSLREIF